MIRKRDRWKGYRDPSRASSPLSLTQRKGSPESHRKHGHLTVVYARARHSGARGPDLNYFCKLSFTGTLPRPFIYILSVAAFLQDRAEQLQQRLDSP